MSLSDKETLELNELCSATVDGKLTDAQRERLSQLLTQSEDARQFYVRAMSLSASLYDYAGEMHAEAPDAARQRSPLSRVSAWWWGALAAAACIVIGFIIVERPPSSGEPGTPIEADEFVARLTALKECHWTDPSAALAAGQLIRKGQTVDLGGGFAEITFDSGAQLVLEGPAAVEIISAWDTRLRRGTLRANVPPEAIGFSVANEAVEVVDLGTEFSMIADGTGAAEVLVLKGEVEATPQGANRQESILLRENQSLRFAHDGVSDVADSREKFARFALPLSLDRFAQSVKYVRWSFDEMGGKVLKADSFDQPMSDCDARIESVPADLASARSEGRLNRALRFDGRLYGAATVPGLSGNSPRTISFFVKIEPEAQLSSAYAMVAWWAENRQLGSRPFHIGWNRNPSEGTVGVLRTDYAGGYALGATPLRDGRWHHIAVVVVPGEAGRVAEVKQYVDGRLEGEGHPAPIVSATWSGQNPAVSDRIWFGCRLGDTGPRKNRFRGEMDELCIADHVLGPREIVHLMKEGRPLQPEMASSKPSTQ